MVMFGDDLERIINQQVQAKWDCRRCGTSFTFQGGITCAHENGIADKVVMCAKCNSVYRVDVTPGGGFALLDEVTHKYPKVTSGEHPKVTSGRNEGRLKSRWRALIGRK